MLIPKANRKAIYQHLFKEGVIVADKDTNAPKHMELTDIPNLQVIMACKVRARGAPACVSVCVPVCVCVAREGERMGGLAARRSEDEQKESVWPFSLSLVSLACLSFLAAAAAAVLRCGNEQITSGGGGAVFSPFC